jgi:hypothetical protein
MSFHFLKMFCAVGHNKLLKVSKSPHPTAPYPYGGWFTKSGENVVSIFLLLSGIKVATQLVGLEKRWSPEEDSPPFLHYFSLPKSLLAKYSRKSLIYLLVDANAAPSGLFSLSPPFSASISAPLCLYLRPPLPPFSAPLCLYLRPTLLLSTPTPSFSMSDPTSISASILDPALPLFPSMPLHVSPLSMSLSRAPCRYLRAPPFLSPSPSPSTVQYTRKNLTG